MAQMRNGQFLVVLDALDEGRLRANDDNFIAFLRTLCELLKEPRPRPCIVALGRADAAEWASTFFELEGEIPFAHLEIEFFDQQAATDFISRQLDYLCTARKLSPAHRLHQRAFADARDAFFERAAGLLGMRERGGGSPWNVRAVRRVLGYAPILVGVAEFLADRDQRNYERVSQDLRRAEVDSGRAGIWQLFLRILSGILDREQDKVVADGIRARLKPAADKIGWSAWQTLYTPDEQRVRILARSRLKAEQPSLPLDLPPALRDQYDEEIQKHVTEHPFLGKDLDGFASVVFREDTYAWVLDSPDVPSTEKNKLRARLKQTDYLFSPIFSESLAARAAARAIPVTVSAADFGFVHESRCQSFEQFELEFYQDADTGTIVANFQVDPDTQATPLVAHVSRSDEGIHFLRRLANATVNIPVPVTLGLEGSSFYLGPNVDLRCPILYVAGDITAKVPEDSRGVVLSADECVHGHRPPRLEGEGVLTVEWKSPTYPWDKYAVAHAPAADVDINEFGFDLVDALRSLSIRGWSFIDLTNKPNRLRFPDHVMKVFRDRGIVLRRRTTPVRGDAESKPEINPDIRSILIGNRLLLAKWVLPDSLRTHLRLPR